MRNSCVQETSAKIVNGIKIKQINNRFELVNILNEIRDANSTISKVKLVIIDSLPSVFHHTGDLNSNLIVINHFVNIMRYLAKENKICFIITNILLQNLNLFSNEPALNNFKPGLGTYWYTIPHFRLKLTKSEDYCDISLIKSTNLPTRSCQVQISNSGVIQIIKLFQLLLIFIPSNLLLPFALVSQMNLVVSQLKIYFFYL